MREEETERRRSYYEHRFEATGGLDWDKAPGKDVIVRALHHATANGELTANERVLDLGCGTGFLLDRIGREVSGAWELNGIDLSEAAIGIGRQHFPELNLLAGDASACPFEDSSFSLIISYGSPEHFVAAADAIIEIRRLLTAGGRFYCMIPTLGVYRNDRNDEGWYPDLNGQPQWNLRRETWADIFESHGLCLSSAEVAAAAGAQKPGVFYFGSNPH